jgi:uncharacterized protein (DUF4415 family)
LLPSLTLKTTKYSELFRSEKLKNMSKKSTSTQYGTDWERLKNLKDEDIDFSDIPPITPEMFKNPIVRKGLKPIPKENQENTPIDRDIIEFFKAQDFNYPAKINQLLRAYMEEHRAK